MYKSRLTGVCVHDLYYGNQSLYEFAEVSSFPGRCYKEELLK